jgi:hypothetical protein
MPDNDEIIIEINLGRLGPLLLALVLLVLFFTAHQVRARRSEQPQAPAVSQSLFKGSYYLTSNAYDGADAVTACTAGYRMAALWEILDTSNLLYDTILGYKIVPSDQGSGPPTGTAGWVRTGGVPSIGTGAGNGNCGVWTQNFPLTYGTLAWLPNDWSTTAVKIGVWLTNSRECINAYRVWCYRPPVVVFLPLVVR